MTASRMYCLFLLLVLPWQLQAQVNQLTYEQLEVKYNEAWTFKNLQLIPVRFKDPALGAKQSRPVMSLSQGMASKKVRVREVQSKEGSDIYTLEVKNESKESVMVHSGDLLAGGKQDRIITEDKIIEAGATDFVSVYCVEKGRWDDKPKPFTFSGAANAELRKTVDVNKRQTEVWKEIEKQYAAAGKVTSTSSILQLFTWGRVSDSSYINFFNSKYAQSDSNHAGFIAITGNKIIFCELFSSADLTRLAFPSLLNSAVATAIRTGNAPSVDVASIKAFLDKFLIDEETQKTFIGAHGRMQQNAGLVFHLIAYGD